MNEQYFKLKYAITFFLLLLLVSIFNYSMIKNEINDYLPISWGDPIEISRGDITKDIGTYYSNDHYILSHIDGENLKVLKVSDLGDVIQTISIPLETKFIKNIDIIADNNNIYVTFTQRTKSTDSFKVIALNNNFEIISQNKIDDVKLSSCIQGSLYALAHNNSISIIDISTLNIISKTDTPLIIQMDTVQIGDSSYIVYYDGDKNFYSMSYKDTIVSSPQKIMQITAHDIKIENLRTIESNGDLLIILKHIDMSFNNVGKDLGDFIYRYSINSKTSKEPHSINDSLNYLGISPIATKVIKSNNNIKLLAITKDKIGTQTTSENLLSFSINPDNSLNPLGPVNSFVKYYNYGSMNNESIFYVEYEKHGSKILKMTSQNKDYINKYLDDNTYERRIVNNLFGDKYITALIMMMFTFVVLGFIYGVAMVAHMIIYSKFMEQKGTLLIIAVSIFAFLGKLIVFNSVFYGKNLIFLSNLFQPFWKCILINLLISVFTTIWNIRYYHKNDMDISYPEIFALFFLDGFISLLIFYPSIFLINRNQAMSLVLFNLNIFLTHY